MARDGSGNYTLPAGNPVVTGTTIDSSWANDTMDDIATELQDSLSRSGKGGMLTAFQFADGTVGSPGQTWTSETSSGFYRNGTNDVRYSIAGVDRLQIRADATEPVRIWNSTAGAWKNLVSEGGDYTITGTWSFSGTLTVPEATVTAHEAALSITESQISDLGTYMSDLVNDTTPQLGGNLDMNGNTIAGIAEANLLDKTAAETISAQWVFTTSPILDGDITEADYGTGGKVQNGVGSYVPVGFNVMPVYEKDTAGTFDLAHNGLLWHNDGAATIAFTCDNDATIPVGATYVVANESSAGTHTIEEGTGVTLTWLDGATTGGQTGNRTLASGGVCTVYKRTDTEFLIWGNGLS